MSTSVRDRIARLAANEGFEGLVRLGFLSLVAAPLSDREIYEAIGSVPVVARSITRRASGWRASARVQAELYAFDEGGRALDAARMRLLAWCERGGAYAARFYPDHLLDAIRAGHIELNETLYALASDEDYFIGQLYHHPSDLRLPLRVIECALEAASASDDVLRMAALTLALADRHVKFAQQSPLDALRNGLDDRAWRLVDRQPVEERPNWHMLLAWELAARGNPEKAKAALHRMRKCEPQEYEHVATFLAGRASEIDLDATVEGLLTVHSAKVHQQLVRSLALERATNGDLVGAKKVADLLANTGRPHSALPDVVDHLVCANRLDEGYKLAVHLQAPDHLSHFLERMLDFHPHEAGSKRFLLLLEAIPNCKTRDPIALKTVECLVRNGRLADAQSIAPTLNDASRCARALALASLPSRAQAMLVRIPAASDAVPVLSALARTQPRFIEDTIHLLDTLTGTTRLRLALTFAQDVLDNGRADVAKKVLAAAIAQVEEPNHDDPWPLVRIEEMQWKLGFEDDARRTCSLNHTGHSHPSDRGRGMFVRLRFDGRTRDVDAIPDEPTIDTVQTAMLRGGIMEADPLAAVVASRARDDEDGLDTLLGLAAFWRSHGEKRRADEAVDQALNVCRAIDSDDNPFSIARLMYALLEDDRIDDAIEVVTRSRIEQMEKRHYHYELIASRLVQRGEEARARDLLSAALLPPKPSAGHQGSFHRRQLPILQDVECMMGNARIETRDLRGWETLIGDGGACGVYSVEARSEEEKEVLALCMQAAILRWRGPQEARFEVLDNAESLARGLGLPQRILALARVGRAHANDGDEDAAHHLLDEAYQQLSVVSAEHALECSILLAQGYARLGQMAPARVLFKQTMQGLRLVPESVKKADDTKWLAKAMAQAGEFDLALEAASAMPHGVASAGKIGGWQHRRMGPTKDDVKAGIAAAAASRGNVDFAMRIAMSIRKKRIPFAGLVAFSEVATNLSLLGLDDEAARAARLSGSDSVAVRVAMMQVIRGNPEGAMQTYRVAAKGAPNECLDLAWALVASGHHEAFKKLLPVAGQSQWASRQIVAMLPDVYPDATDALRAAYPWLDEVRKQQAPPSQNDRWR